MEIEKLFIELVNGNYSVVEEFIEKIEGEKE